MRASRGRLAAWAIRVALTAVPTLAACPASAQHVHAGHARADSAWVRPATRGGAHAGMEMGPASAHVTTMEHHHGAMPGLLGAYSGTREASGTSWQPEAAPHHALHAARGPWSAMLHGYTQGVADRQGGPRGGGRVFANQMVMGAVSRGLGPARLGWRAMMTAEPATIGKRGYPLLLQTGETADGVRPLIDRQHPHDLFMELAMTASVARAGRSAFLYAALPGEPALGPPVFMHRLSGACFPEAPIAHHWLDSSHISYGVLTAGLISGPVKLDASLFRGREPDERRWNLEAPKLDSHAIRVSWNPTPAWSLQASGGRLESPEQLDPGVDVVRSTVSVMHDRALASGRWEWTLAWGRNQARPGRALDAWLAESVWESGRRDLFARAERVEKDELFPPGDGRAGQAFAVGKLGLGGVEEAWRFGRFRWGIGGLVTLSLVPEALVDVYGGTPVSGMVFVQIRPDAMEGEMAPMGGMAE